MKDYEERRSLSHPDQTQLTIGCPAQFVPGSIYSKGSVLQDILRFQERVYIELYLATHGRR
jgi:hypothetical protein